MVDRFRSRPAKDAAPAQEMARDETYTVGAADDPSEFSFEIDFPESLAWEEAERIDKRAELLHARPEIERAFREDREFILVDAAGVDMLTMQRIVAEEWVRAAEGTQYRQFNDDGDLEKAERPA